MYEDKDIHIPVRKTKYSAGYDVEAAEDVVIHPFKLGCKPTLIPTGLKAYCLEDEYYMLMKKVPRKTRHVEQKNLAGKSVKYSIKIGSNISVETMKRILLHVFPGELD